MNTRFITFLFLTVFLTSCNKEECQESDLYVNSSGPVYEGWPLKLYFNADYSSNVEVIGPNGYRRTFNPSETDGIIYIDSTTLEHSGIYTINLYANNCIVSSGRTDVDVLPIPTPNCSIPNNTGSTTIGGFGGSTFSSVSTSSQSNSFIIAGAYNTYNALSFRFKTRPRPGKYKSRSGYSPDTDSENECAVLLQTPYHDVFIHTGQDIYVTEQNGKLHVTMCPSEFSNPVSTTPLYISARLVQP